MNWDEIDKVKMKYPDMFLSFLEDGIAKNVKLWLPIQIIDKIRTMIRQN